MYSFQETVPNQEVWTRIEDAYDSTCFQTRKWCIYLDRIGYRPYIVEVSQEDDIIAYFIGTKIGHGISAVCAPMDGVGTYTQGLSSMRQLSEDERITIYQDLSRWLFSTHRALFLQVDDWQLSRTFSEWIPNEQFHQVTLDEKGIPYTVRPTLYVPVNTSEEEMWAGLHYKSCKYSINKAHKHGLYVREITRFEDIADFTDIHYKQLVEVCARKGTHPKPSQHRNRMQALCESLFPDRVIMLEVIGKDENGKEQIMSSGIYCIDKGECSYWTGASYQRYQKYCPNELMVWEAMRLANQRMGGVMNFCGMHSYKLKFGTVYAYVPRLIFTKYTWLRKAKIYAQRIYFFFRNSMVNVTLRVKHNLQENK